MSSFWKFFTGEEGEGPPAPEGAASPDPKATPSPPKARSQPAPPPKLPGTMMEPTPTAPAAAAKAALPERTGYGIDDAIKLMRTLPIDENAELVVRVMKSTLESLRVRVGDILEDATKRQDALKKKIGDYQAQIVQFEREIDARRHEIARLEGELAETTKVRERLQLAESLPATPQAPPAVPMRSAPPLPSVRPKPPELPKKMPSIPPKAEVEAPSPSPSPAASEAREGEKPS